MQSTKYLSKQIDRLQESVGGIGELASTAGIDAGQIRSIIEGRIQNPPIRLLIKLAQAGGITVDRLLERPEE